MIKKSNISLEIEKPCDKNWDEMLPNPTGRFCLHCEENIIDFTDMTDDEVIEILSNAKRKVCGKFKASQVNRPLNLTGNLSSRPQFKKMLAAFMIIAAAGNVACGTPQQSAKTMQSANKGIYNNQREDTSKDMTVTENKDGKPNTIVGNAFYTSDYEPVRGMVIMIKGTVIGTVCDLDGNFELKIPESELTKKKITILFSSIGCVTQTLEISPDELPLKVKVLMRESEIILGEVIMKPYTPML